VSRARAALEGATGLEKELEGRRLVALGNLDLQASPARAVELYERAALVLRDAHDAANEAVAVADLGIAALGEGALDLAAERLERALALARDAGDARNEARILTKIGHVQLLERDSRRACATLEEAMARLADVGDPRVEAEVLRRLARAYLELGDPEKAEGDALRAAEIARAVRDEPGAREAEAVAREARKEMGE
jgi:tetratricopeptide (TPR) repeat protein